MVGDKVNPGIYTDLSHGDYLAKTDWVSASQLKRHLPEFYKPFNGSPSADVGSVLHQRFTGEDVPVRVVDAATWVGKPAKAEWEAAQAAGEYAILTKDVPIIDGMEAAIRDHAEASKLVAAVQAWETSVFAEVDGVPSRCRFDGLTDTESVDLKTTKAGPGKYSLTKAVLDYGYDLSHAHYNAIAEAAGIVLEAATYVFVENTSPFHVTVVTLDEPFMERGRALRDLALERYLHPQMTDAYPGQTGRLELTLPGWAKL